MGKAQKVSVSIDADDLKWLRREARRNGGNLSAVIAKGTRLLRQQAARKRVLEYLGDVADATPEQEAAIVAEWKG